LYRLENFRHFSQRHTNIALQLGQWNFEAPSLGFIGRLHDVHTGRTIDFWDK
jgi:hypothetical protein